MLFKFNIRIKIPVFSVRKVESSFIKGSGLKSTVTVMWQHLVRCLVGHTREMWVILKWKMANLNCC